MESARETSESIFCESYIYTHTHTPDKFQLDRITKKLETTEITKCEDFGNEILRVHSSTVALVARSNTKHGWVNTKRH